MSNPDIQPGDLVEGEDFYGEFIAGTVGEVYGNQIYLESCQQVFDPTKLADRSIHLPTNSRGDRPPIAPNFSPTVDLPTNSPSSE
jgi:hypothetical protein